MKSLTVKVLIWWVQRCAITPKRGEHFVLFALSRCYICTYSYIFSTSGLWHAYFNIWVLKWKSTTSFLWHLIVSSCCLLLLCACFIIALLAIRWNNFDCCFKLKLTDFWLHTCIHIYIYKNFKVSFKYLR